MRTDYQCMSVIKAKAGTTHCCESIKLTDSVWHISPSGCVFCSLVPIRHRRKRQRRVRVCVTGVVLVADPGIRADRRPLQSHAGHHSYTICCCHSHLLRLGVMEETTGMILFYILNDDWNHLECIVRVLYRIGQCQIIFIFKINIHKDYTVLLCLVRTNNSFPEVRVPIIHSREYHSHATLSPV